ncbi:LacI family DNA-binding transcriptional regulator [Actinophytocola sp.]|uniref:LacI family DNA-binding transcriptional regulator n=1 Tax=Actinophytocola sp. TaxID=1872138 RepID=UPI003D6C608A
MSESVRRTPLAELGGKRQHVAKQKEPTVREIADRVGVSVATVSRVARGVGQVSPQMRQRVLEAIKRYNYRPRHPGRASDPRPHAALGVVVPGRAGPYYTEVIAGFEDEAVTAHLSMEVLGTHLLRDSPDLALDMADRVDGIAVMGGAVSGEAYEAIADRCEHIVRFAAPPAAGVPTVRTQSRHAFERLSAHLIGAHGHRRLAFVGNPFGSPDVFARWEGFRAAHGAAGLAEPARPLELGLAQHDGILAANHLLGLDPRPTAIACANDELAVGVLVTALSAGLRVPDDLAITGFDDIPMAAITNPALTTIHQPLRELGAQTARVLRRHIAGDCDADLDLVLDTELVLRASCGCPH